MRKFLLVTIIFLSLISSAPVYAQSDDESGVKITNGDGFQVQLHQYTQDPGDNTIKFDFIIFSLIDSDRVQVTWNVSGVSQVIGSREQSLTVKKGNVYRSSIVVRPRQLGVTDVAVRVEAFGISGNHISTASTLLGSYTSGELINQDENYLLVKIIYTVRSLLVILLIITVIVLISLYGYHRFRVWLQKK